MRQSAPSVHASPPVMIGRYRILTRIASGGMGAVFLAETDWVPGSPPQRVALKVLHSHHGEDEEITTRFVDEARVAGRIVHPNVVQVLDAGRADEYAYMALEYVHGDTLSGLLKACTARGTPFPLGVASAIAIDFLEGLHAAHQAVDDDGATLGLVHRDVSPQNILIGSLTGRAYVTDFGVAKVKDRIRATRSGSMIGKTGYMAPEQVAGGIVSARTDLYAAGIVLWESLVGQKLFDGLEAQIQAAVTRKPPPAVGTRRPEVPPAIDELVRELLQHAHDRRPASAHDVAERIRVALPPASPEEVAAWVSEIVAPKLEERERRVTASLNAAADELFLEDASHPSRASLVDPAELADSILTRADEAVEAPLRHIAKRRTWVAGLVAAGLVVATVAFIVALSRPTMVAASEPTIERRPDRVVAAPEPPKVDRPPVMVSPPVVPPVAAPKRPAAPVAPANPAVKPAKPPSAGACSPPYVIENGIKRYKAECFGGGK